MSRSIFLFRTCISEVVLDAYVQKVITNFLPWIWISVAVPDVKIHKFKGFK